MDQLYSQSLELVRRSGAVVIDDAVMAGINTQLEEALEGLRTAHAQNTLPFLRVPEWRDDIGLITRALDGLGRGAADFVIFGTGGSSLGGQALSQLAGWGVAGYDTGYRDTGYRETGYQNRPRLHFMDNLDPDTMTALLSGLDPKTSRFIAISKSGNTPETLMQMLLAIEAIKQAGLEWNIAQHFLSVTMPESAGAENALRAISRRYDIPILDHPAEIGGRYSALTITGLIPALLLHLDAIGLREGAQSVIDPLLNGTRASDYAPAAGAAIQAYFLRRANNSTNIFMPYGEKFKKFGQWFVQLWSESLGKQGQGTTPIAANGPVDQHSQLQLFLDGPPDKFFTILMRAVSRRGPMAPEALARDPQIGYLAGKTVGDLVDSQQRATAQTLANKGRPVRVIEIAELNERTMGALMMHYMIETVLMAHILDVDPFDQPAVEDGKKLTRKFLKPEPGPGGTN